MGRDKWILIRKRKNRRRKGNGNKRKEKEKLNKGKKKQLINNTIVHHKMTDAQTTLE